MWQPHFGSLSHPTHHHQSTLSFILNTVWACVSMLHISLNFQSYFLFNKHTSQRVQCIREHIYFVSADCVLCVCVAVWQCVLCGFSVAGGNWQTRMERCEYISNLSGTSRWNMHSAKPALTPRIYNIVYIYVAESNRLPSMHSSLCCSDSILFCVALHYSTCNSNTSHHYFSVAREYETFPYSIQTAHRHTTHNTQH